MVLYGGLEDSELLEKSRAGDNLAFAEILTRYTPMINKAISCFPNQNISHNEAFNEASMALHKAVMSFDTGHDSSFGTFAKVCVKNRMYDLFLRSGSRELTVDMDGVAEEKEALTEITPSPMDSLLIEEKRGEIFALAREILGSEYEYSVFELYFKGYDTDSICRVLARDKKSVENAKARMLKKLRVKSERFSNF